MATTVSCLPLQSCRQSSFSIQTYHRCNLQPTTRRLSTCSGFKYNSLNNTRDLISPAVSCIKPLFQQRPLLGRRASWDLAAAVSLSSGGDVSLSSGGETKSADKASSWVDLYLPEWCQPYAKLARLEKPIGTWLLLWPFAWSVMLAANPGSLPDLKMLILFGYGSVLLRGAACTINDILDKDIDAKVERTKSRPIASGMVTPFKAFLFLGLQVILGYGILFPMNNYSRVLGALFLPLILLYPLMKRITDWPQAFLGLTFNWGALWGWSTIKGSLNPAIVFPLYISGICWTLVYDTIYAHQDKKDDFKLGVKSTALKFGDSTKKWITGFGTACISSFALCGFNAHLGWPYYLCLGVAAGHMVWQIYTVDLSNPDDCSRKFISNIGFGAIIFSAILFGKAT